jgi:aspartate/methionine/tyrosine aminotransferase
MFALAPPCGYDERQLVNGGNAVPGLVHELFVLPVRYRLNGDEKIVEMHFVCRPFIGVCVLGPHHENAGWDQRKFRKKVSWHQGAVPTGYRKLSGSTRRLGTSTFSYTFAEMKLESFLMERLQSTWENRVAWNLSESGVHPLRLEELAVSEEDRAALFGQELGYTQTNGTPELRAAITSLYPAARVDNVLVTNGGSEANCIALWHLVEPGDEIVMMMPNYMQLRGIARGLGATVRPWALVERDGRWRADLDALAGLVSPATRLIAICNPNNPTGARLSSEEVDEICRIAGRVGAWVLSDEIYRGAELDSVETPSIWGRYDRAFVTSGLSKAFGLPGLRIGWVVGPAPLVEALWGVHDYTSIAPGALSDRLARVALGRRDFIIARTRGIVSANYPLVKKWIEKRAPALTHLAPEAGAILLVRYRHPINSTTLVERLRDEQSVLLVPGDHFDMDGYLRIGFGNHPAYVSSALELVGTVLDGLA